MTESDANTRMPAGADEVLAGQEASDAIISLFNQLLEFGYQDKKEAIDGLVTAIHSHKINIRAVLDFDTSGPLSFKFHALRPDQEPKEIIDVLPNRKLNS